MLPWANLTGMFILNNVTPTFQVKAYGLRKIKGRIMFKWFIHTLLLKRYETSYRTTYTFLAINVGVYVTFYD